MKTLYEFLVKGHVSNKSETFIELYQYGSKNSSYYWALIDDITVIDELCNIHKNINKAELYAEYDNAVKLNNGILFIRPSKLRSMGFSTMIMVDYYNIIYKTTIEIPLDDFTVEYWKKNKWYAK